MIYLMQNRDFFKIGYTDNLEGRLSSLQTSNPETILLAVIDGDIKEEKLLHKKFEKYRYSNEWFFKSIDIYEYFKSTTNDNKYSNLSTNISIPVDPKSKIFSDIRAFRFLLYFGTFMSESRRNHCGNILYIDNFIKSYVCKMMHIEIPSFRNTLSYMIRNNMMIKHPSLKNTYVLNPNYFYKGEHSHHIKCIQYYNTLENNKLEE